MPRFVAVPVGQGDAFYLDRGEWSVLVDGGRSKNTFGAAFQTTTGATAIGVVVCTHNDADHADGILGFLQPGPLACNELWLPGRWLGTLPGVLRPFVEVLGDLAEQVATEQLLELEHPPTGATPLEQFAEQLPVEESYGEDGVPLQEDGWPEDLLERLEEAEDWDNGFPWPWLPHPDDWVPPLCPWGYFGLDPRGIRLLWSAIDAAQKIRAIATAAFHRGLPIRWFEYDAVNPRGGCPQLRPLNAREIARVRPIVGSLLRALALTVSNKGSLVFWSPPADSFPGVLFNADSDLAGITLPPDLKGAIITAPHHGSEANRNAYNAAQTAAGTDATSLTWARSDGRYPSRPGQSFKGVHGRRACTICNLGGGTVSRKQTVQFFARSGSWVRHRSTCLCTCR